MNIWDNLNPFTKVIEGAVEVVDKFVLDKDAALQIKAHIEALRVEGEKLTIENDRIRMELDAALKQTIEQSHQIALQNKTIPWIDALYKIARPLLGFYSITINAGVVLILALSGIEIDGNVLGIMGLSNATAAAYVHVKGTGIDKSG